MAEIFPNCTLPLQLSHTNTIITFNATNFPNKLDISFEANYTIFNSGNTTTIPIIAPLSLALDINHLIFNVKMNNAQIPYDLINATPWDENLTAIDVYFLPRFIDLYPINLVRSNITIPKKNTSFIQYSFKGSIINPLKSRVPFYLTYYIGTWQEWEGNTTGKIELRVYGKEPGFATGGRDLSTMTPQYVKIDGGTSFSYAWNNVKVPLMDVGIVYYKESSLFEEIIVIIANFIPIILLISITTIIIVVVIKKRKRK
jgi:hypothetical protein